MLVEASVIINYFFNSVSYQLYSADADRHLEIRAAGVHYFQESFPRGS